MVIRKLLSSDLHPLFGVFDSFVRDLPHGFPVGPEEFCDSLSGQPAHLRSGDVAVAEENGVPVGFLRAGIYRSVGDRWSFAKPGEGLIFGPFVGPEHADAGERLVAAATRLLRDRLNGSGNLFAFDPIESVGAPYYNGGWSGLSERRPHVVTLYARTGFRLRYRELCLIRPTLSGIPSAAPPPARLTLSLETRDRHRHSVKLYDRGVYAGACHYSRMHPRRACAPDAMARGYIDGLGVPEDYQGRGLGRLLLLHGLHRLRELGCDSASLTTSADNFRAQNLYFSLGFKVVDSCVTFVRSG